MRGRLGSRHRGGMGQRAAQVLAESGSDLAGERPRLLEQVGELFLGVGQLERLQPVGIAVSVLAEQYEVARVRDEHQAVLVPVAADLGAVGGQPCVVAGSL